MFAFSSSYILLLFARSVQGVGGSFLSVAGEIYVVVFFMLFFFFYMFYNIELGPPAKYLHKSYHYHHQ